MSQRTFTDFHFFNGMGGFALGFRNGHARVGWSRARFRGLGGIDVNAAACADFERVVGLPATCLDLFSEDQYRAFHGHAPPAGWREATPEDIRRAAGYEAPDVLALSPPCKGFSGLLNKRAAASRRYQALNQLVTRSLMLAMEAWADDPPALIILENVPMIATRGRHLVDVVVALLQHHGYSVAETVHDCGELGGLAQHRKRFLLVARHRGKVPPFLYQPPHQRVRAVGEVLDGLPLPEDPDCGPMHRLPRLQWKTWVRLALIPAGGDWRSLEGLDWERYGIVRYGQHVGKLRVEPWDAPTHTITGSDRVGSGALSVADPRWFRDVLGVIPWGSPIGTVTGRSTPTTGRFSISDPRPPRDLGRYQPYGVVRWDDPSRTVTGEAAPGAGPYSIADPRQGCDASDRQRRRFNNVYRVARWDQASPAVTGGTGPSAGGVSIADPRVRSKREGGSFASARHFGVVGWDESSPAVIGHAKHDNGAHSVADPRLPEDKDRPDPVPMIIAEDGTWHRPFTTMELAALQGFPVPVEMEGRSHSAWRERIGNAVPPPAAQAIAETMGRVLLLASVGGTMELGLEPVWVRPVATALAVETPE